MSLNRYAAARDKNEPAIRKRFAHHGWHTEQLSGAGMPDLLCWPGFIELASGTRIETGHAAYLVDVKMPKGTLKPAQVKKWTALHAKGVPVYVVRTEEDVDALVGGSLVPWAPATTERDVLNAIHAAVGCKCRGCASIRRRGGTPTADPSERPTKRAPRIAYIPPRSTPVDAAKRSSLGAEVMAEMLKPPGQENYDAALRRSLAAAKEAEETFAPPALCLRCGVLEATLGNYCFPCSEGT